VLKTGDTTTGSLAIDPGDLTVYPAGGSLTLCGTSGTYPKTPETPAFYHGTSSDRIRSIKNSGLRAPEGEGVYLSTDPLQARRWGEMKYPEAKKIAL
jgi:hypothetical protein